MFFYKKLSWIVILLCLSGCFKTRSRTLRVMSYNIHHGCDANGQLQLKEIASLINEDSADIIGLIEVDSVCRRSDKTNQPALLGKMTSRHVAFVRHFPFDGGAYGLALLSKFPITGVKNVRIPVMTDENGDTTRALLFAQLTLPDQQQITVAVAHLDYRSKVSRIRQTNFLMDLIKSRSEPVLLLGDLNATPGAASIQELKTTFVDANKSNDKTYPGKSPNKKIDYIMVSKPHFVKTLRDTVYPVKFSDHLPIAATIMISSE